VSANVTPVVLQQINMGYDADQDRILLRVGLSDDSEVASWLTRRLVKVLWTLMQQAQVSLLTLAEVPSVASHAMADTDASFSPETSGPAVATITSIGGNPVGQYDQAYRARQKSRFEQPLLATTCHMKTAPNGQLSLVFGTQNGASLDITLTPDLLQAISHMVQMAAQEANWDISFASNRVLIKEAKARPVLH
jgi:hypothetical protein